MDKQRIWLRVRRLTQNILVMAACFSSMIAVPVQAAPAARAAAVDMPSENAPTTVDAVTLPVPLANIQAIAVGQVHACALTTAGGVLCWGNNNFGQLGNNDTADAVTTPVPVSGLGSGIVAITAGALHTCALTSEGGVLCWGRNADGQLGNDSTTDRTTPVAVVGLTTGVAMVAAGDDHTCAVTTGGGVKCWGNNVVGQLGNNSTTDRDTPVNVTGLGSGVRAVGAGTAHSCALTESGGVKCWGGNLDGQIGDNTNVQRKTPVDVDTLETGVASLSVSGYHACVVTTEGGVKCWGNNNIGQLGVPAPADEWTAVDVPSLASGIVALDGGSNHTCALTLDSGVKCWGGNTNGAFGNGATDSTHVPVDAIGWTSGVLQIGVGALHTCALLVGGTVQCTGHNGYGQLGSGTTVQRTLAGDVVQFATCYALALTHGGDGGNPVATPSQTPGCPPGHYLPQAIVVVTASPAVNRFVQSWGGTDNNGLRDVLNYLTMPAADHSVQVTYGVCRQLTLAHTGTGGNPTALPGNSTGCSAGRYAPSEKITLVAAPGADQRVASWADADQAPGTGNLVNTLTMPNAGRTVTAAYEPCFQLSATTAGQGDPLAASPVASYGCAPGMYVAGQSIVLSAAPAAGWTVDSWSGTADDGATSATNMVTMPNQAVAVGVTYAESTSNGGATSLFLPLLQQ